MPIQRRRVWGPIVVAGLSYLVIAIALWWHAWSAGASTHTLCGCGDPALFLWFFQWPATAVAHGHNPFYSSALFHPGGINLLSQTSVLGLSIPLIPVTWIWGPVASLNLAATLAPALSAFTMLLVLRRWVKWMPAAYIGGLLFGFSPAVLTSLQFAHLMTAALMLVPLILAALDEILWRQRHERAAGAALGILLFLQFFMSTEILTVIAMVTVISVLVLAGAGFLLDRQRLRQVIPHALRALIIAMVVGGVLLAYPVWFALDGPAHLSGLIWPNIGALGGYDGSNFVSAGVNHGPNVYTTLGGYEGSAFPSSAFIGWGFLTALVAGTAIWFRDRRLWFYGFLLGLCMVFSLGERKGAWEPVRVFAHIPLIENIIVQRFMEIGYLAAAVILAIILDHMRRHLPAQLRVKGAEARVLGVGAAFGVIFLALLPMATAFGAALPYTMRPVSMPRWYTQVAPHLPANSVVLSYPVPFSGIQVAMAWQAVDAMHYNQVGGGGPQGVANRAGSARAGFNILSHLAFSVTVPQPVPSHKMLAAVRHALRVWGTTTVVVSPERRRVPQLLQGHNPVYAAAFMTAALGRPPTLEAGSWVWNGVSTDHQAPLNVTTKYFNYCVDYTPKYRATSDVSNCIEYVSRLR